MRVTTSDGSFGFIIERTEIQKFFVFQLVINGQLIGNREPCILGTAMQQLQNLARLKTGFLPSDKTSVSALVALIKANDHWNDATLRPLAESFDGWRLRGFTDGPMATFIAGPSLAPEKSKTLMLKSIPLSEYKSIVSAIESFWAASDSFVQE